VTAMWVGVVAVFNTCGAAEEGEYVRGDTPDSAAAPITMVYECDDGYGFVARIEGDTAWLFLPGQTLALLQAPGSRMQYEYDDVGFTREGEHAQLWRQTDPERDCVNNRGRAIWEHAKLNGVHFRAVGNEPGWYLEIGSERIVLVTDYGESRYDFPAVEPGVDESNRTAIYETSEGEYRLTVTIEARGCTDAMSGESFGSTVSVLLDDRVLRGCGRALH
jgi:uncharacterized membrane protein